MSLRRPLIALPLAAAALALPSGAHATTRTLRVGIADQTPAMFDAPDWQQLDQRRTRYVIAWNAIDHPAQLAQADAFMAAAKAHHVSVLLHISTDDYTPRAAKLPSVSSYRRKVGELVDRYYEEGVREYGAWNEANDRTQPTYRSPSRAASYFKTLWHLLDDGDRCGRNLTRRCRVVALDVLDGRTKANQANARSFIRRFYGALSSTWDRRARFVGLHNYSDTNRHSSKGTRNTMAEVRRHQRRARIWLTETGGVVKLGDTGDFKCEASSPTSVRRAEQHADSAVHWMFTLAKRYRSRIDRLYVYQWSGSSCATRFDAGLTRADGSARPALAEVQRQVQTSRIVKP